jgi:hypothetical protein
MTETSKIDPFEYFGFTENGKTWGFEFLTLFLWALRSNVPINPYTKVALSSDTRVRLFRTWCFRIRHRKAPNVLSSLETCRLLARIFQDNGFMDIGAQSFLDVPKGTWVRFFRILQQELLAMYAETDLVRRRGIMTCRRMEHFIHTGTHQVFCDISATNLLRLLTIPRDPYLLCFSILSCFYRC